MRARSGSTRIPPLVSVGLFVVLLCICALPVLAFGAEPPEEAPIQTEAATQEEMLAATRRNEAEVAAAEEKFEEELSTPAAEEERESSQTEYGQVDASEASELLDEQFAPTIERLNEDPGRFLSTVEVEKLLGPDAARVSSALTGRAIVESSAPLVSSLGGEPGEPIDLTLERSGESFSPTNPAVPTELPLTAEEPIELGQGVGVQIPTSDDHEAVQVGQMSLFYPETETTTDTMIAPVAGGVEIFDQLRSPASPEELRFEIDVPNGARLEAIPEGGAEVVSSDGSTLEQIPAPSSVDAQGATVPTTMTVEGDSLVLDVDLGQAQPAYPVLVDPKVLIEEEKNFAAWGFDSNAAYGAVGDGAHLELWSQGSNYSYGANTHAAYTYTSPGPTAWIEAATFSSISFFPNKCGGNQPHGYIGLYNPGAARWEKEARWEGLSATGGEEWQTGWTGHPGTEWAVFGLGTANASVANSCVHEFYLGGYSIQEKDTTPPTITSVSGVPLHEWFDPEKVGEGSFTAIDSGFGVYEISMGDAGAQTSGQRPFNCTGVYGSRCPHEWTFRSKPSYESGKRAFHVWAKDPMKNEAPSFTSETWVDLYAPAVELKGQFARATEEVGYSGEGAHNLADENKLRLPVYELQIHATDGKNTGNPLELESGVQTVKVFLDGKEQALPKNWGVQTCAASESSCPLSGVYPLQLVGLAAGIHTLEVVATDRVGHSTKRQIEFEYIPATGEGENQVLEHFPLPDGEGGPAGGGEESSQPEVAVNVINGNLVFHQQDAEVATTDAGLPVERTYNSQLPSAQSGEFGTGWTLDEATEIEGTGGGKATVVQGDGELETAVPLPTQEGHTEFVPSTHDAIEKTGQGYAVTDEGESAEPTADVATSGITTHLQGSAEATLNLEHEAGQLSELLADDPGTASGKAEQEVVEPSLSYLFTGEAGGELASQGRLSDPVATATDSAGDVYVADAGHDRVQVFDKEGAFVRQWGGKGSGAGAFKEIVAIAVGPEGHVYVAEPTRVDVFEESGEYLEALGGFSNLVSISMDPHGNLFALEAGMGYEPISHIVERFAASGVSTELALPWGGTELGKVENPLAIAVSEGGAGVLVTDASNRVQQFSVSGGNLKAVSQFGATGSGPGQFNRPGGIAVDRANNIWVADIGNDRVEEFSSKGGFLGQLGGPGGGHGQFSEPRGLSTDNSGDVWLADAGNDRLQEIGTTVQFAGDAGNDTVTGDLAHPVGTATDSAGDVYVADAGHDKVQEFDKEGHFVRAWGGAGTGPGAFTKISSIAVGPEGHVYVAELTRLQIFTASGEFIEQETEFSDLVAICFDPQGEFYGVEGNNPKGVYNLFGGQLINWYTLEILGHLSVTKTHFTLPRGTALGDVSEANGIAVAEGGKTIWISDKGNERVDKLELSGTLLSRKLKAVGQFGTQGTGAGQVLEPGGLAVDHSGNVWVADTGNDRLEEFNSTGGFVTQVGAPGDGQRQFAAPQSLSMDNAGDIWVADTRNDRAQKLGTTTKFELVAGEFTSAAGKLSVPVATATDSLGDVYVADAGHDRVQEFNKEGNLVREWGGAGTGAGAFNEMVGIARGPEGHVYVAEPTRIQVFTAEGAPVETITGLTGLTAISVDSKNDLFGLEDGTGTNPPARVYERPAGGAAVEATLAYGSAAGQAINPKAIAASGASAIWIADTGNNRVDEFSLSGGALHAIRQVGSVGTGRSKFSEPEGIAVDSSGDVFVTDTGNDRVQELTSTGTWMTKFGMVGGDPGMMSAPHGLAVDTSGNVWIANTADDRIDKWTPAKAPARAPVEAAPSAMVETSGSLVDAIEGPTTGTITYDHQGAHLTEVQTPGSTTHYTYDPQGRLKRIELPHGTYAEVEYEGMGRVEWLTVSVEGKTPEQTFFEYPTSPNEPVTRETVVHRPSKPATHYAISEEGAVLRWWDTATPPVIEEPTGSLWDQRSEVHSGTVTLNDMDLVLKAVSPHGIESIQVVANGSQVVAEKSCEEPHPWECESLEKFYETETGDWPPGILSLEVIVKDAIGGTNTLRFSDDIPYTPPPNDPELEPPTFEQIRQFREEFGLDLDLKGNERAIAERIFNLIDAWHEPGTPEGQVAQASWEKWGVPLRAADVAELEYRERYIEQDAAEITTWAAGNAKTSYAGWNVENAAGGIVRVGFTAEEAAHVAALKSYLASQGVPAVDRVEPASSPPSYPLVSLYEMAEKLMSSPGAGTLEVVSVDEAADRIDVEALQQGPAESWVRERLGSGAPVQVTEGDLQPMSAKLNAKQLRHAVEGPLYAGQEIASSFREEGQLFWNACTAGVGAREPLGKKVNGQETYLNFVLTAGHCGNYEDEGPWGRHSQPGDGPENVFGTLTRDSLEVEQDHFTTDVAAIAIHNGLAPPTEILPTNGAGLTPVQGVAPVVPKEPLCLSGGRSGRVLQGTAGKTVTFVDLPKHDDRRTIEEVWYPWTYEPAAVFPTRPMEGDSGGPIYRCGTGKVVGLLSALNGNHPALFMTPMLPPAEPEEPLVQYGEFKRDQAPGIVNAPGMGNLQIVHGR